MIGSSLSEVYFQFLCNYKEYLDSSTPFYKLLCTTETRWQASVSIVFRTYNLQIQKCDSPYEIKHMVARHKASIAEKSQKFCRGAGVWKNQQIYEERQTKW